MNTTTSSRQDQAHDAWMDEQIAQSDYAEKQELEAFQTWQANQLEDDPEADVSEQAYLDHLEGLLPED